MLLFFLLFTLALLGGIFIGRSDKLLAQVTNAKQLEQRAIKPLVMEEFRTIETVLAELYPSDNKLKELSIDYDYNKLTAAEYEERWRARLAATEIHLVQAKEQEAQAAKKKAKALEANRKALDANSKMIEERTKEGVPLLEPGGIITLPPGSSYRNAENVIQEMITKYNSVRRVHKDKTGRLIDDDIWEGNEWN